MPTRRRDPVSVPRSLYSSSRPSYGHHDFAIDESISRAGYFSNAILDDTEAAAARSRGKDYDLLRNTHSAIIDTELHSSPRVAAASRRARATSVPPMVQSVQSRPARLHQHLTNSRRPQVVGGSSGTETTPSIIFVTSPVVVSASRMSNEEFSPAVHAEVPWRVRADSVGPYNSGIRSQSSSIRAGSMPPARRVSVAYNQDSSNSSQHHPVLGTEALQAHRRPPVGLRSRAGSVPPQRTISIHEDRAGYYYTAPSMRSLRSGSVQGVGTEGLRAHNPSFMSRMSRASSVSGGLNTRPLDLGYDEDLDRRTASVLRKPKNVVERKFGRDVAFRASSEPPKFIAPSESYPRISDVLPARTLFARRGHLGVGRYPLGASTSNNAQSSIYSNGPYQSSYLQASRAPMPKAPTNDRKPIRTVDGFTKPKNVMSWEHRVESRLSPDDLIYKPASFGRMRDQLRGTQEKMDRHRQLLDRYLDSDLRPIVRNNNVDTPHSSVKIPDYYYAGTDPLNAPMSDVRRRVRRTLNATRSHRD